MRCERSNVRCSRAASLLTRRLQFRHAIGSEASRSPGASSHIVVMMRNGSSIKTVSGSTWKA